MPRTLRLHDFTGPSGLRLDELPAPAPGPGEALLRIQAIGLSRDQIPYLEGADCGASIRPELPARFGYEVSGIVGAVGEGVDAAWVGTRVAPIGPWDQDRYGAAAEQALVPADRLVAAPDALDPAHAAALWVPFLTAHALVTAAGVHGGDHVVIPAASSVVGLAALQIVRDAGGLPIALTRTQDRAERLLELGAHAVVVTGTEDVVARVMEITGGAGARITLDPISGGFLDVAAQSAAPGGIIIEYGLLGGIPDSFPLGPVIGKGLTIRGFTVDEIVRDPQVREQAAAWTLERAADGRFAPHVSRTFPIEQVQEAFAHLSSDPGFGRTVLVTDAAAQR